MKIHLQKRGNLILTFFNIFFRYNLVTLQFMTLNLNN